MAAPDLELTREATSGGTVAVMHAGLGRRGGASNAQSARLHTPVVKSFNPAQARRAPPPKARLIVVALQRTVGTRILVWCSGIAVRDNCMSSVCGCRPAGLD